MLTALSVLGMQVFYTSAVFSWPIFILVLPSMTHEDCTDTKSKPCNGKCAGYGSGSCTSTAVRSSSPPTSFQQTSGRSLLYKMSSPATRVLYTSRSADLNHIVFVLTVQCKALTIHLMQAGLFDVTIVQSVSCYLTFVSGLQIQSG